MLLCVHPIGIMKSNYEIALVNEKVILAPYRKYQRNQATVGYLLRIFN